MLFFEYKVVNVKHNLFIELDPYWYIEESKRTYVFYVLKVIID